MQVGEIDHEAEAHAVEDIAERAAEHHAERDLVALLFSRPSQTATADRDRPGHRDQHPAPDSGLGVEHPEGDPVVLGPAEIEDRQQHDLAPT